MPRADAAVVKHVRADDLEQRFHAGRELVRGADHDTDRPGVGPVRTAAYRCIEQSDPLARQLGRHRPSRVRITGGHIRDQIPGFSPNASPSEPKVAVRTSSEVGRRPRVLRRRRAEFGETGHCLGPQIVDPHPVLEQQAARQRAAHFAEPDLAESHSTLPSRSSDMRSQARCR